MDNGAIFTRSNTIPVYPCLTPEAGQTGDAENLVVWLSHNIGKSTYPHGLLEEAAEERVRSTVRSWLQEIWYLLPLPEVPYEAMIEHV